MAYDSDESGRVEVFVQSYPDPSVKRWRVSPASGSEPLWTRDGKELVFRKGDSVMAASMNLANGRRASRRCCSPDRTRTVPGGPGRGDTMRPPMASVS